MTNYYVGYQQADNEYVFVASIDATNIKVVTNLEGAISLDTVELATDLLNLVTNAVANQDYKVLEITTTIKEVK